MPRRPIVKRSIRNKKVLAKTRTINSKKTKRRKYNEKG